MGDEDSSGTPRGTGWAAYQPLHKYLKMRFADTVVLTFAEIEDLLGFALPALARERVEWWTTSESEDSSRSYSRSWLQASRIAIPNLGARKVAFERTGA